MLPPRLTTSWSSGSDSMAVDGPFAAQLSAGCDVLFKRLAPAPKPAVSCVPEGEGLETAEAAEPGFGVVPNEANEAAMSDGNRAAAAVPHYAAAAAPEAPSTAGAFAQLPPPQGELLRRKRSLLDVAVASSPFGTRRNKECAYAAAPAAAVSAAVGVAADALAHMNEHELNLRQQQQQHLQRHQQHQQSHVFANSVALSTFAAAPPMVVPADFAFNSNASAMSLSASMFNSNVSMYNSNNSVRSRCDSSDGYSDSAGDGASRPRSRSMGTGSLHVDVKREDSDMQVRVYTIIKLTRADIVKLAIFER
jgi:hypothetical protein